jgi:hypothetical protein
MTEPIPDEVIAELASTGHARLPNGVLLLGSAGAGFAGLPYSQQNFAGDPAAAQRDVPAERDYAEWRGWMEAQDYHFDDDSYQAEAFAAGMQAQRDLDAATPGTRPASYLHDIVCHLLDLFGAPDDRLMQHSSVTRATLQRYAAEAGVRLDGRPS